MPSGGALGEGSRTVDLDAFLSANIVNKSSHGLQHRRYSDKKKKKIYIGYLRIYIALLMQDKGENNFPLKLESLIHMMLTVSVINYGFTLTPRLFTSS